jgi:hypothetical protein
MLIWIQAFVQYAYSDTKFSLKKNEKRLYLLINKYSIQYNRPDLYEALVSSRKLPPAVKKTFQLVRPKIFLIYRLLLAK